MRKIAILFTLLLASAACCVSCVRLAAQAVAPEFAGPFPPTADAEARRVQELAMQVVEVRNSSITVSPTRGGQTRASYGSGFVLGVRRIGAGWRGLVVTNNHVCDVSSRLDDQTVVVRESLEVQNANGELLSARRLVNDVDDDTCVLEVDGIPGRVATLAPSDPPFGAIVEHLGNDESEYQRALEVYSSGRYTGKRPMVVRVPDSRRKDAVRRVRLRMSMLASGGASGSPVFYQGRVVGMATATATEGVAHITYCVELADLQKIAARAVDAWK